MLRIEWKNQTLDLLADRAMLWHEQEALIIADPHFGKGASFRQQGLPVPTGSTEKDLQQLSIICDLYRPKRLYILGDFFHSRESQTKDVHRLLKHWTESQENLELHLISGNHDKHAGDPPKELGFRIYREELVCPPFVFSHFPRTSDDGYTLCGHLHPGIQLRRKAGDKLKLPCFAFYESYAVLPSFGSFTGKHYVELNDPERIFLCAHTEVIELPQHLRESESF